MLQLLKKIKNVHSFQLLNEEFYHINHKDQLFHNDKIIHENIGSFYYLNDYLFLRNKNLQSWILNKQGKEIYSSKENKSILFPRSFLSNRIFIAEFQHNKLDFNNLKYTLWASPIPHPLPFSSLVLPLPSPLPPDGTEFLF